MIRTAKIIKADSAPDEVGLFDKVMVKYEDFLNIIKEEPLNHEICYVPYKENWGQNQHVYVFDKSGLQVWVWRGKIRTIIIYDSNT